MDMLNKAKTGLVNGLAIGAAVGSIIGGAVFQRHRIHDPRSIVSYPA